MSNELVMWIQGIVKTENTDLITLQIKLGHKVLYIIPTARMPPIDRLCVVPVDIIIPLKQLWRLYIPKCLAIFSKICYRKDIHIKQEKK